MKKITKEGWAILDNDTHFSKWIEETGQIDHGQRHESNWQNILPPGGVGIDIGANLGDTAVPMGRLVGSGGRVLAFEPNPEAFECLQHNIRHAGLSGVISPYPFGASDSDQDNVPFSISGNVGASFVITDNRERSALINLRRLDGIILGAVDRVDFIKIDVEGMEIKAIKGMIQSIEKFRPLIQLELASHSERYGMDKLGVVSEMLLLGYTPDVPLISIQESPQIDVVFRPTGRILPAISD